MSEGIVDYRSREREREREKPLIVAVVAVYFSAAQNLFQYSNRPSSRKEKRL